MARKSKKTSSTWSDVKARLADFDRAGLLGVIQDLYAPTRASPFFMPVSDWAMTCSPPAVIDRWLWPDVIKNQNTSVATAKKAITDFKKAAGQPDALTELMVFFCERAAGFSNDSGFQEEGYLNALVSMFEQALKQSLTLSADSRDAMLDRLDAVRDISHNLGYGIGDNMDYLLHKHSGR